MDDCIFCRILKGDIPAERVYESDLVLAITDANPQAPHHYLIIPKKHIPEITSIEDKDIQIIGEMIKAIKTITKAKGIKKGGFRTVMNQGEFGGQTVYHLHMHLLGGRPLAWPPG